jgi:hypothetical protein
LSVTAAGWGLLGTFVGGFITIAGNWIVQRAGRAEREASERVQAAERARDQRKDAYLRLLTAARRLRYLARPGATRDTEEIDSLRTELSSVNYEIELMSSPEIASRADDVRRKTLDYLNAALEASPIEESEPVQLLRHTARAAIDNFIKAAQFDLGLAPAARVNA